jgi:hypothetical protein
MFKPNFSPEVLGDLSDNFANSLVPSASENHDFTYTVQVSDPNPLVNTVTVHANPQDLTNDITDNASATVTMVVVHPGIDITKVACPTTVCIVNNVCEEKYQCEKNLWGDELWSNNLCDQHHLCDEDRYFCGSKCGEQSQTCCSKPGTVTYTITITNTGDITLENITVMDSPAGRPIRLLR